MFETGGDQRELLHEGVQQPSDTMMLFNATLLH
jgi:hypothetical protein